MIVCNGLGQVSAVLAKDAAASDEVKVLHDCLRDWLDGIFGVQDNCLVRCVQAVNQKDYAIATHEALQWAGWVKKFSGALVAPLIPKEEGGRGDAADLG